MSLVAVFVGNSPTAGGMWRQSQTDCRRRDVAQLVAVSRCTDAKRVAGAVQLGLAGTVRSLHSGSRATRIVLTTNCSSVLGRNWLRGAALAASSFRSAAVGLSCGLHMTRRHAGSCDQKLWGWRRPGLPQSSPPAEVRSTR